ncbi:alkaline phosphatase [Kroppenstedtia eburnea]|uniref:Alkaline phosphatase n=1 Tax=Kroppenstedtia eburnea TaxID=714067 RepID=A0A1N7PE53_9BACL|nr:alkaline phosphatase [Kroppenstedtia eburnea]EGK11073.1 alkaline phosphatase [Desmospora sp. 8437]QKI83326.1 alkaline phosphatase [Kroppenstedtia eburnea]SIT08807.1 alkaline phosphatase [Kroppenstedtia eburnea]
MTRRRFLVLLSAVFLIAGGLIGGFSFADAKGTSPVKEANSIKNVILLIGDGMGPVYTTAYRYYQDDPRSKHVGETIFDKHFVGMQTTYAWDPDENITDSASAATAMASGVKTYNAAISVDLDGQPVETVLERAKSLGKSTGLVATSQINHATPAAFAAHNESRRNYDAIADEFYDERIDGKHKVDVMLGGGTDYFIRDDRNLVKQFQQDGYDYVTTRAELLNSKNDKLLGLFAKVELPKRIDRTDETPALKEMTQAALQRLGKNKKGFFLMVEGSQIDWAGHDNDVVGAMSEMEDFAQALQTAINFAKKDKQTLVIATADHSTGGLSIGSDGKYVWNTEPIKQAKRTPEFMANQIVNGADVEETLNRYIGFALTNKEMQTVKEASASGKAATVQKAISHIFDVRSNTGWTTSGHTADDVEVFAYGKGKEMFAGRIDNTDIANRIFDIWKR